MLKPFKIRKPDFSIKRPSLRIKLHRPNLELNNLAAELHIPANKSFRRELARKSIHLSSLWIPALIYLAHPGVSIMLFAILFWATPCWNTAISKNGAGPDELSACCFSKPCAIRNASVPNFRSAAQCMCLPRQLSVPCFFQTDCSHRSDCHADFRHLRCSFRQGFRYKKII